jgi:shikimate kinase
MGSGKTTVAKQLSDRKGLPFIDCDTYLETQENSSISDIFKLKGECYFREKETELLSTLLVSKSSIVSTGGGCITSPQNQLILKKLGYIIYLHCEFSVLLKRLSSEHEKRPLLQGNNFENRLKQLFNKRLPLYRKVATIEIDTTTESIKSITNQLITIIDKK